MNKEYKKKGIVSLLIICFSLSLVFPVFVYAENAETPEDFNEEQETFFQKVKTELPIILNKLWEEKILPIWRKIWSFVKDWINLTFKPWVNEEIEKRKGDIVDEFEKEKQEMREDIENELPGIKDSIWNKIKELFQ